MAEPFKIGIAGLGTVGAGLVELLQKNAEIISARVGRNIQIIAVNARDKFKDRGVDLSSYAWADKPVDLLSHDIGCVVELIGGEGGAALDLVSAALERKIHVVTANKAMLAHHGLTLAAKAERADVALAYEAAVAGGIPIIKTIREGLAGNTIEKLYGILNGTCNYILTEMRQTGRSYEDVLAEAQKLGYAEADPTFDIEGVDAAHKLCLLTALAFGVQPDFSALPVNGISGVTAQDISFAAELGYKIKLLGKAHMKDGALIQAVEPCLVKADSPVGSVEGVFNAIYLQGDFAGPVMAEGRGAGAGPTASAVMADIIDIARGEVRNVFGCRTDDLVPARAVSAQDRHGRFYLRLNVLDQSGVIAEVSAVLRDHAISIESLTQRGRDPGQPVDVVMVTHEAARIKMDSALAAIASLNVIQDKPVLMPIEEI